MSKKFWLSRLLGKFGKKGKVVVESVVEEPTIEESSTVTETIIEEPTVEESQEVKKKAKELTAEEKRRIRVLRYLGYQD